MEEGFPLKLMLSEVLFPMLSLLFCLVDVVLDLWAAECLYADKNYFYMGLLIFLLLSSSCLLQIFSWLWYTDPCISLQTRIEKFIIEHGLLALVHFLQLGLFLRFVAVMEISICRYKQTGVFPRTVTVYMNHDLRMLRLIEAFSESAPQIILMMKVIIEMQEMQSFTVVKILGSLLALTFSMFSYHRNMRAFVPEKFRMGWSSSVMYFLLNLFLIGSRVICVSLFASVLPCYLTAHFMSLWILLVLWAWWQKTDFMDSNAGEWLYRATVGLIWYFSWFNVTDGRTKHTGIVYHLVMGVDTMLLLGLWWWRISVESARFDPFPINPYLIIVILITSYITGILLKLVYCWKFHPHTPALHIIVKGERSQTKEKQNSAYVLKESSSENPETEPEPESEGIHKRIKHTAVNFYS